MQRIGVSGISRNGQDRSLRGEQSRGCIRITGCAAEFAHRHSRTGAIARHGRRPGTRTVIVKRASIANFGGWDSKGKGGFVKSPSLWRAFLPILSARAERIGPRRDGQAAESRQANPGGPPPRQGKTKPAKKAAAGASPRPTGTGGISYRSPYRTGLRRNGQDRSLRVQRIGASGKPRNGQDRSLRCFVSAVREIAERSRPFPTVQRGGDRFIFPGA
jgi:hypothetical protein